MNSTRTRIRYLRIAVKERTACMPAEHRNQFLGGSRGSPAHCRSGAISFRHVKAFRVRGYPTHGSNCVMTSSRTSLPLPTFTLPRMCPFPCESQPPRAIMVQERGEPLCPVLSGCLTYAVERAGRAGPSLSPGRDTLAHVPLGSLPSLPHLRGPFLGSVSSAVLRSDPTSHVRPSSPCVLTLRDAASTDAEANTGSPGSHARCVHTCSGSQTVRGSCPSCVGEERDVAFRILAVRRHPGVQQYFAAQYPAHVCSCQRFAAGLTNGGA